jgi:hypothetical protein
MQYFTMLWREFRSLLAKLENLPHHPYSPFYARWETVLEERTKLLRQQAAEARRVQELGVVATWKGWVLVDSAKDQASK